LNLIHIGYRMKDLHNVATFQDKDSVTTSQSFFSKYNAFVWHFTTWYKTYFNV